MRDRDQRHGREVSTGMPHRFVANIVIATCLLIAAAPRAQTTESWHDSSPHRVQLVTVDANVRLEVLDWGGSGRPLVFLAGAGNTAHVFDDFAPLLTNEGHVYGITRRGYGASSAPATGYTVDRLGADVLHVLDALALDHPVLIGHSIAGQEISFVATNHPERLAAAVYLDGAYRYAFHRPGARDNLQDLKRKLDVLEAELNQPPRAPSQLSKAIRTVMGDTLDEFQLDLRELTTAPDATPVSPQQPSSSDLKDVAAYRAWSVRVFGYALPDAEVRAGRAIGVDGTVGQSTAPAEIGRMIQAGGQRFTTIAVPMLAIFASPHDQGPWTRSDPATRATFEAFARFDEAMTEHQAAWVERRVPGARVVRLPYLHHYLFLSHPFDIRREVLAFLKGLAPSRKSG